MSDERHITFRVFGWSVRISFEKVQPQVVIEPKFQPKITKKKQKSGFTYCPITDKVGYPEALAKLKAEQLRKGASHLYFRAYRCEFCPHWHLTHLKNKLTMH